MAKPRCLICKKPCEPTDRNSDGSYAHDQCLRVTMTKPYPQFKKEAK